MGIDGPAISRVRVDIERTIDMPFADRLFHNSVDHRRLAMPSRDMLHQPHGTALHNHDAVRR